MLCRNPHPAAPSWPAPNDKLDDAVDAVCETPARTMRGLIAKARIGEIDPEVVGQCVAQSIIDDLLALNAVGGAA
jgi:hypothetical protein